jgi:hypothetical protein
VAQSIIGTYKIAYSHQDLEKNGLQPVCMHACMTKRVMEIPRSTHAFAVENARIIILKNHTNQMRLNGTKKHDASSTTTWHICICGSSGNLVW